MKKVKTVAFEIKNRENNNTNLVLGYSDGEYTVKTSDFVTRYIGEEMIELFDLDENDLIILRSQLK